MGMSAKEVLELANKKKEIKEAEDQPQVSSGTYFRDFEKRLDEVAMAKPGKSPKFFLNFLPPVTKKVKGSSFASKAKAKRYASNTRNEKPSSFLVQILTEPKQSKKGQSKKKDDKDLKSRISKKISKLGSSSKNLSTKRSRGLSRSNSILSSMSKASKVSSSNKSNSSLKTSSFNDSNSPRESNVKTPPKLNVERSETKSVVNGSTSSPRSPLLLKTDLGSV